VKKDEKTEYRSNIFFKYPISNRECPIMKLKSIKKGKNTESSTQETGFRILNST